MSRALELFRMDLGLKLKRALAFRANFALNLAIALFYSLLFSVFQFFVYQGIEGYPGWDPEELLLFQSALLFWTGCTDFLFGGIRSFIDLEVTYGNFDRFFVWPAHPLLSLFTRGTNVHAASTTLAGAVGLVVMSARLELHPSLGALLLFALFFVSGITFYVALLVFYCACTLFMVKMERLREVFDRIVFFASFPADLYFSLGRAVVLIAFPMALWVYLPVQALLGRWDGAALGSVASSAVFLFLALRFWSRQERRYVSAGG